MIRAAAALLVASVLVVFGLRPGAATTPVNLVRLDPTFGNGGLITYDIGGPGPGGPNTDHEDEPYWYAIQPDGNIVLAGKAHNPGVNGSMDFAALRFHSNGTLDTSFGWGGVVLVDFLGAWDEALSVALQPDGKLVFAGLAGRPNGNADVGLVRLNANGSRDTTFGWNGLVMTDFFGLKDQALGVAVLPDGKIVAAGYATRPTSGSDLALLRYNPSGGLDKTFGVGGVSIADYWGKTDALYKLTVQPDGKLLGTGIATRPDGSTDFAVARFDANGAPDNTFGWGGRVATDFFGKSDLGLSLLLLPDGKIVAGGLAFNPATNSQDLALAKFNANGSTDTSFGAAPRPGLVTTDFFGLYDQALWLALQPDGKIFTFGHSKHPVRSFEFAMTRFTPSGTLDPSFGVGGHVSTDFYGGPDGIHAGALFPDGTALAIGDAYNPASNSDDFALARYLIADPSWIAGVASSMPSSAFAPGQQSAVLAALNSAQASVTNGNAAGSLATMQDLRTHLDACPAAPDGNDWIIVCAQQQQVRTLVDQVIAKLSTP
ncbi:MAG TPA: hypothetical protein VIH21_06965 [Dehalococcoidia bacterium]